METDIKTKDELNNTEVNHCETKINLTNTTEYILSWSSTSGPGSFF